MPRILPNTTTADQYPGTAGGAQIGIGDIFGSGFFVVANAAVFCQYFHGLRGQSDNSDELFLPPGTYPLTATEKDPLGGLRFRSAVTGTPAQVFGVLYYPNEATLLASSEFTASVSPGGGISGGGSIVTYRKNTVKAVNNTVAATDLLNGEISLASSVLGTNGFMRLTAFGNILQNTGANRTPPRFQILLNGTTVMDTGVSGLIAASATRTKFIAECCIMNAAVASQIADLFMSIGGTEAVTGIQNSFTTGVGEYSSVNRQSPPGQIIASGSNDGLAINTAVACPLVLNVINGFADPNYEVKLLGALVEIL